MSLLEQPQPCDMKPSAQGAMVVFRVDVMPLSRTCADTIHMPKIGELLVHPVYWICADPAHETHIHTLAQQALIDPLLQTYVVSQFSKGPQALPKWTDDFNVVLEKRFLPGVTDNVANTVSSAIAMLLPEACHAMQVATGTMYWGQGSDATHWAEVMAHELYNPLIQSLRSNTPDAMFIHEAGFLFPHVTDHALPTVHPVALDGDDDALLGISQQRHLALTLEEMCAIRDYFLQPTVQATRQKQQLPVWPTDVELEVLAQTWSEHCKHKIFAAHIRYEDYGDPDFPYQEDIDGLFNTFIKAPTETLMSKRPDLLSVFSDNAGVIRWNDTLGVCFKVETHNSPSALEPYGGALTGIVGVNRDILGTGLGAKPLFNTDVFCFAHPERPYVDRPTMLPPEAILQGVRQGVEDGGNKSGIPTVNGSLFFDARYRAKPLVFCGTGGLLPLTVAEQDGTGKYTQPGDRIVMVGGRVGKDGIHGATFSSEALHEGSPVSAVQIGDPLTQRRMTEFLIAARDKGLITGLTDNGAGGLSSSVGEMAELTHGATIALEQVPLKYPGLLPYEIVISESQERMTLSTRHEKEMQALADHYGVEMTVIGEFHSNGSFDLTYDGELVASLDLDFLHHGVPQMQLTAKWIPERIPISQGKPRAALGDVLLQLLASPNICSREALIRQYDHEVQGRSVIKPLMGEQQLAPCDAAVIQPVLGETKGLVISNGLCPQYSDWDAYHMAACAVDEAVRNAVAVGADPKSLVLLDNFCWPDPLPGKRNPEWQEKLVQLVRACKALKYMALAYETPFISGKDSMKNDFDDGIFRLSIPPTLLISAIGHMPDYHQAVSMEFKAPGDVVCLLGLTGSHLGGSEYHRLMGWCNRYAPRVDVVLARAVYKTLHHCIQQGWIRSCHDLSEGGFGVALAESTLASSWGVSVCLEPIQDLSPELRWDDILFSETPSRFVLSVNPEHLESIQQAFGDLPLMPIGTVVEEPALIVHAKKLDDVPLMKIAKTALVKAWHRAPAACYESGMQP